MTKKAAKKKLTPELRTLIKSEFVQGCETETGDRKHYTIEELIKKHNEKRAKHLVKEGKAFDDKFISKSQEIIEQVEYYFKMNTDALKMKSKPFPPQQLLGLCNALTVAQKLSKVAMGEVTENINVNSTVKEAESFRRVMDLLHGIKRDRINSDSESLH